MYLEINLVICFIALIIGSYTDFKTREVPDWINFALMFLAGGTALIYSCIEMNFMLFLNAACGFLLGVGVGYLMYYTGQWGGGDAKMIMGLFGLIGLDLVALIKAGNIPLIFDFLVNILIFGGLFGLLWIIGSMIKKRKAFFVAYRERMDSKNIKKLRKIIYAVVFVFIVLTLFVPDAWKLITLVMAFGSFMLYYLYQVGKVVEKSCFVEEIDPKKLVEGDWLAEDVMYKGKKIAAKETLGLEKTQIEKIVKLYKQRRIKKVKVRSGVPFVPGFLLAFLVTIWGMSIEMAGPVTLLFSIL